jgi:hypothetical protein
MNQRPVNITPDLAARYAEPDQIERFDAAVRKVFGISIERAAEIRRESTVNPTPRGRQPKGKIAPSRVPVAFPHA